MNDRENQELGDLILQITKGNTEAIGEIFKRVGSAMEAVASIYLKNAADVEDVVQDSLVTIVTKASKFRENRNAKAWINTIVHNIHEECTIANDLYSKSPLQNILSFPASSLIATRKAISMFY